MNRTDRALPTQWFSSSIPRSCHSPTLQPAFSLSWAPPLPDDPEHDPSASTVLSVKRGDGGSALAAGEMRGQRGEGNFLPQRPTIEPSLLGEFGHPFCTGVN